MDAVTALELLRAGNQRFVAHTVSLTSLISQTQRAEHAREQRPIAIIVGCSDARAPAEMIFDQGLGSLFIVRVAGNVVSPVIVGSVEFAAERFGTSLVVVMGHTHCGAIAAAYEVETEAHAGLSDNLHQVVERVRPAVRAARADHPHVEPAAQKQAAAYINVRNAAAQLRQGSAVLERLIQRDALVVVGAVYDLETGVVDFFDGVPAAT
ncbi:MAG: carbonic anhydrase [Deltaproteobacteria bacterium]|nr:carbonic anhydrase [Deltaproteobacteria bacterium]